MRYEELSKKVVEQYNQIKLLEEMLIDSNKENKLLHGICLVSGYTDVDIRSYTYEQIYFLGENYNECKKRWPGKTDKELLEVIRREFVFIRSNPDNRMKIRNFKDFDHAKSKLV